MTLDRLCIYQDLDASSNFPEIIKNEYNALPNIEDSPEFKEMLKKNIYYKYLKDVAFVILHPEEAIPDENEDDDLKVSGGKISLKDSISLNYFSEPVSSIECKHTYEKLGIMDQIGTNGIIDCPLIGCHAKVKKASLEKDLLMVIRIGAFTRTNKHENRQLDTVI